MTYEPIDTGGVVDAEIVEDDALNGEERLSRLETLLGAAVVKVEDTVATDVARLRDRCPRC